MYKRQNITSFRFLVFGVKGLLQANSSVKNAMLFNVLSFFSDKLLTEGNTCLLYTSPLYRRWRQNEQCGACGGDDHGEPV